MDFEGNDCEHDSIDDIMENYDCELSVRKLPELFDDESVDAYIANLNDWD
jgi:hypothetical protein